MRRRQAVELLEHRALEDGALRGELELGTEALDEAGCLLDEDSTRGAANLVHVPRVVEVAVGDLEGRELGIEIERQVRNAAEMLLDIRRDGGGGEEGGHATPRRRKQSLRGGRQGTKKTSGPPFPPDHRNGGL